MKTLDEIILLANAATTEKDVAAIDYDLYNFCELEENKKELNAWIHHAAHFNYQELSKLGFAAFTEIAFQKSLDQTALLVGAQLTNDNAHPFVHKVAAQRLRHVNLKNLDIWMGDNSHKNILREALLKLLHKWLKEEEEILIQNHEKNKTRIICLHNKISSFDTGIGSIVAVGNEADALWLCDLVKNAPPHIADMAARTLYEWGYREFPDAVRNTAYKNLVERYKKGDEDPDCLSAFIIWALGLMAVFPIHFGVIDILTEAFVRGKALDGAAAVRASMALRSRWGVQVNEEFKKAFSKYSFDKYELFVKLMGPISPESNICKKQI